MTEAPPTPAEQDAEGQRGTLTCRGHRARGRVWVELAELPVLWVRSGGAPATACGGATRDLASQLAGGVDRPATGRAQEGASKQTTRGVLGDGPRPGSPPGSPGCKDTPKLNPGPATEVCTASHSGEQRGPDGRLGVPEMLHRGV